MIRARIRRYFGFSRAETNGTLVLLSILLLLFVVLQSLPLWLGAPALLEQDADMAQLELIAAALDARPQPEQGGDAAFAERQIEESPVLLRPFDPNTASAETLESLGLPVWLASRIVRYREAGGSFRVKQDLSKIYGMEPETYSRLAPYIQLPEVQERPEAAFAKADTPDSVGIAPVAEPKKPAYVPLQVFDLNKADTATLRKIRGIGPALSTRIVAYREKLGGFRDLAQLQEVWGLNDTVIFRLQDWAYIDEETTLSQLSVNEASEEVLREHPYIGRNLARSLVRYREQHGPFGSEADLYKLYTIDSTTVEKLRPYLRY